MIFRMGALDVCPFIPISNVTVEECVEVSKKFGTLLAKVLRKLHILQNRAIISFKSYQ